MVHAEVQTLKQQMLLRQQLLQHLICCLQGLKLPSLASCKSQSLCMCLHASPSCIRSAFTHPLLDQD